MPDSSTTAVSDGIAAPAHAACKQSSSGRGGASYHEILRSFALIGGSSAINILIGILRTKGMALLLGPAGFGVLSIYLQIIELAKSIAQMGINGSGVRQIAEAVATADNYRIDRTVTVLRRASMVCAILGALSLVALSTQISKFSFGDDRHATPVALLAGAVFFYVVTGAQGALLQGMRRIADIAKLTVLGGLAGLVIGLPMVHALSEDGLAPTLVVIAAVTATASWWFSRRIKIARVSCSASELGSEAVDLLKLGMAFLVSALLTNTAAYLVRVMVLRQSGMEAAGTYSAAWTLGGLYIGIILTALGSDFYPRLVGVAGDNAECNRLVNEQTHISVLIAIPGVLATITVAPFVVAIFYSSEYRPAADILRWICIGMALRVLTWPLGYIVVAKNLQMTFLLIEVAWTVVNVASTWWLVHAFGADGAGMAFSFSYLFHAAMIYPIARRITKFRWSRENRRAASLYFGLVALVFIGCQTLPTTAATCVGLVSTLAASFISLRSILKMTSVHEQPKIVARIRSMLGMKL
jgi:PST family polysaccharide transporter